MKRRVKDMILYLRKRYLLSQKRKLTNRDFTIISDNCWGTNIYSDLGLEYNSPFIGLGVMLPDYLKLLNNLEYYLEQDLKFADKSKFENINIQRQDNRYPLGRLDDIELQMGNYKDEEEAKVKWDRRVKRVNFDNLFIKLSAEENISDEDILEFNKISHKNKVIFTKGDKLGLPNEVNFAKFSPRKEMLMYNMYFDYIAWLNSGNDIFKE